jgi:hypothetical protein
MNTIDIIAISSRTTTTPARPRGLSPVSACVLLAALGAAACGQTDAQVQQSVDRQNAALQARKENRRQEDVADATAMFEAQKAAMVTAQDKANEQTRAHLAEVSAKSTAQAVARNQACTATRPTRVASMQKSVSEHNAFMAKAQPKIAWYQTHCNEAAHEKASETNGHSRPEKGPDGVYCSGQTPKRYENILDYTRCNERGDETAVISNRYEDNVWACSMVDEAALGVSLVEVACGSAGAEERAKVLALPVTSP